MPFVSSTTHAVRTLIAYLALASGTMNGQDSDSKFVSALANKNVAPIVPEKHGIPAFGEDFDWQEYQRVIDVLKAAASQVDEEVWKEMLQNLDDDRYCTTVTTQNGKTLNLTVGQVCRNLAAESIWAAYGSRIQPANVEYTLKLRRLAGFRGFDEMKGLLAKKSGMTLHQIQIEIGREALRNIRDAELTGEERADWEKKIRENLAQLEQKGKAIKPSWFGPEQFEIFTKAKIARLRGSER